MGQWAHDMAAAIEIDPCWALDVEGIRPLSTIGLGSLGLRDSNDTEERSCLLGTGIAIMRTDTLLWKRRGGPRIQTTKRYPPFIMFSTTPCRQYYFEVQVLVLYLNIIWYVVCRRCCHLAGASTNSTVVYTATDNKCLLGY